MSVAGGLKLGQRADEGAVVDDGVVRRVGESTLGGSRDEKLPVGPLRSKAAKKRLILSTEQPHGGGVETSDLAYLIGSEGTAKTDLRPAGIATIGDERIDVVSEGGFVNKQTLIKVVAVDGPRVIVARIE